MREEKQEGSECAVDGRRGLRDRMTGCWGVLIHLSDY